MPKRSAGLLMYRRTASGLEVFLVRPGGPYWAKKGGGAWGIPKGEYDKDEEPLDAAKREFAEETGFTATGPFVELGAVTQKSGKIVTAWAMEGDCNPTELVSNTCSLEWPPRSGKFVEIPEIEQGHWFGMADARETIRKAQQPLLERLQDALTGAER